MARLGLGGAFLSMTWSFNNRANAVQDILLQALEIEDRQHREAFLEQACHGDAGMRREVEDLIRAAESAGGFLPREPGTKGVIDQVEDLGEKLASSQSVCGMEKPGDQVGHYKLLRQIGEGGYGVVYLAEQGKPVHRKVALKILKLGMDTKSVVARFEAERQALALMDHPSIARVLDAGATERGRPFFVMELVEGHQITRFCHEHQLSVASRLRLFIQVCRAIQHAHQKGIIHRDLKPSNILVTFQDGVPVPKVIDFGIAKATQGRLSDQTFFTAVEQFLGTPVYMSPEQAAGFGKDIDTRSDIYSLGVLLYELLTGKTPFETAMIYAVPVEEIRRVIREGALTRPSTRLSGMMPERLNRAATQCGVSALRLVQLVRGDLDDSAQIN